MTRVAKKQTKLYKIFYIYNVINFANIVSYYEDIQIILNLKI